MGTMVNAPLIASHGLRHVAIPSLVRKAADHDACNLNSHAGSKQWVRDSKGWRKIVEKELLLNRCLQRPSPRPLTQSLLRPAKPESKKRKRRTKEMRGGADDGGAGMGGSTWVACAHHT